ncbi:hypothetical protein CAMGR0001_0676 [Campylobacter gracilis RM3268]|uniref:Transposase n=1 Tax=Campylobacter gracilis RM3268 TaxID=553220 RepID=C8PFN3_9BACT|nr:hypothetical protein CAMGR0001_0676 [Campylobacter gracilis RM3268]
MRRASGRGEFSLLKFHGRAGLARQNTDSICAGLNLKARNFIKRRSGAR